VDATARNLVTEPRARITTWLTIAVERRLLVVVRTVTTLSRLLDVVSLTGDDWRIQTVFTHDSARHPARGAGVEEALRALGVLFMPWPEAAATRFDLAIAASENDELAQLNAPVLLYPDSSSVSDLNPERLAVAGRVVPAAITLPHFAHRQRLAQVSPEAAERGVVVGDPALARMSASAFRADHLRAAFGADDKRLVVLASTAGPDSALGRQPDLPERLTAALPLDEYRIAVVLHPGVWAAHGPWQVRSWLSQPAAYGAHLVPPHQGWQAALLAAAAVISDHGSLALYAAALDKPLMLTSRGGPVPAPDSPATALAATAPVWDAAADPRDQLDSAIAGHVAGAHDPAVRMLIEPAASVDGCASRLRTLIYDLLQLAEPVAPAAFAPVEPPHGTARPIPAMVAGGDVGPDGVRIIRYADLGYGRPHDGLAYRHLVADPRTATIAQLGAASIVINDGSPAESMPRWTSRAEAELRRWPQATLVAGALDHSSCAVCTTAGVLVLCAAAPLDPLVLASMAYLRLASGGRILPEDKLHLGDRVIAVTATAPL
jgi:hypothetical protein